MYLKIAQKLLKNLKPEKASGPDKIPCKLMKELHHELAPILAAIFTQSVDSGSLPKDWTTAYISPVFKKGKQNLVENLDEHKEPVVTYAQNNTIRRYLQVLMTDRIQF